MNAGRHVCVPTHTGEGRKTWRLCTRGERAAIPTTSSPSSCVVLLGMTHRHWLACGCLQSQPPVLISLSAQPPLQLHKAVSRGQTIKNKQTTKRVSLSTDPSCALSSDAPLCATATITIGDHEVTHIPEQKPHNSNSI